MISSEKAEVVETEWGTLQWLVTGQGGSSQAMTLGRVTIKPGMANPHHHHPNCEEILYVEAGEVEHTLPDGGTVKMKPGDAIVIPQGVWHHARNIGQDEVIVIVSFNDAWRETVGEG